MKQAWRRLGDVLWTLDGLLAVMIYTAILLWLPMPKWRRKA